MPSILGREINLSHVVGKTKTRSQMLLMKTDDGRLVEREVPVLSGCAIDEEICGGFLIDSTNQYQNEKNGFWYQLIDEKSTIPICLLNKDKYDTKKGGKDTQSPMEKLISGIFHHSWTIQLATLDRMHDKEKRNNWIYAAFGITAIASALIFAVTGIF